MLENSFFSYFFKKIKHSKKKLYKKETNFQKINKFSKNRQTFKKKINKTFKNERKTFEKKIKIRKKSKAFKKTKLIRVKVYKNIR